MNYYTSQIPLPLAEKLKEKGMPMEESRYGIFPHFVAKDGVMYFPPTFASTFDWLMDAKRLNIIIKPYWNTDSWESYVTKIPEIDMPKAGREIYVRRTWHEAAEKAIDKALTLI